MMALNPAAAKEGGMMDYGDGCENFVEWWKGGVQTGLRGVVMP